MADDANRRRPDDDEAVAFLTELLRIHSPSTEEQAVAEYIVATMTALGHDARVDAAGNAVVEMGGGADRRHLVLLGHIDTVPGEIPVRREGDVLYGRGSVDAKGPFATFCMAAARAANAGLRLTIIGAVEEEAATSAGAYYAVEHYDRPDFCVIGEPSAWDRITLGYKGRLLLDYRLERSMSHTAGEERGVCEEAVAFWESVRDWAEAFNQDAKGRFDTLDPSLRRINSASDGLCERVEMSLGLRLPLSLDVEQLRAGIASWGGDAVISTRGYEVPFRGSKRGPLTASFLAAIREQGGRPRFVTKTGTSDMNVVGPRWQCPIVAYGPGDSSLDHTPNEYIAVPDYLRAIRVLEKVIRRLGAL